MMAQDAALTTDDNKNEMVMAAMLDAAVKTEVMPKFGGSAKGRKANKERHREPGHMLLYNDYFAQKPANFPHEFCR